MSKKIELKPCPFCGSKDIRLGSKGSSIGVDIYIKCNCGAKVQICEEYGEKELINRWNRRQ